jgi:hypothetical protein
MQNSSFQACLTEIDWKKYNTAYGSAEDIPNLLLSLNHENSEVSMKASHELWCSLCHQHAYVSNAALPALPFLLKSLDCACELLKVEILDILLGLSVCSFAKFPDEEWVVILHQELVKERSRFIMLASDDNEEIAGFSSDILEYL